MATKISDQFFSTEDLATILEEVISIHPNNKFLPKVGYQTLSNATKRRYSLLKRGIGYALETRAASNLAWHSKSIES